MNNYSSNLKYGKNIIAFNVIFADRKTMEIAVYPDANVIVKAPQGTSSQKIETRMLKRAGWIKKQLEYFQQFVPRTPPRRYVGGETHLYLGRQYRLKIRNKSENGVKLKGAYFQITAPDSMDKQNIKSLLDRWYREHAHKIFSHRLELCFKTVKRLKIPIPNNIRLRKMSKRWGSCTKSGDILLNTELIKAPLYCIDYVIMHELCHLKYPMHNTNFYNLLEKVMPDWEKRKHRLELAIV